MLFFQRLASAKQNLYTNHWSITQERIIFLDMARPLSGHYHKDKYLESKLKVCKLNNKKADAIESLS